MIFPIIRKDDRFGVAKSSNRWLHRPYHFLIESMVYNIQIVHCIGQKLHDCPNQTILQNERHNLHADEGKNPISTQPILKRNVARSWSRALTCSAHMRTKGNAELTLNTCALRYFAAGFYNTSKTAHLVQGTQVGSDAGHNNVH